MAYGIDIGVSAVKVVGLRRTLGGFRVIGAGRRRIPKIARDEDLRPVVAKLIYESLGGGDGRRVGVVGLTGRDVNLQVVQQPKTAPANYRTLMRYEVDQRRGEAGDLYADWCTLREPDAYFPQYLAMVGVGKRSYVEDRLATAAGAHVEVRDAVPNAFALFAAYRHSYDLEGGTQLLLDIGADNIDMALVRGGRLVFARNVSTGARIFDSAIAGMGGLGDTEAESRKIQYGNLGAPSGNADPREEEIRPAVRTAAGQLVGVVQSSIQFAKNQLQDRELTIDKIYVSGGGARVRGLVEYLGSALKTAVEVLDPFRRLDARTMQEVEEFGQLPTDLAVAIGLAMISSTATRDAAQLSIVPDAVRRRRNFFGGPVYLMGAAALLVGVLLMLTAVEWLRRRSHEEALRDFTERTQTISRRIDELDRLEEEQRTVVAKAQLLLSQTLAGRGALDVVMKLRKVVPEGVNVRKVEFVDLSDRTHNPLPRKRCLFHLAGRGLVIGAVVKEETDTITLAGGESVPREDAVGYTTWTSPSKGIQIEGEIDDVRGGAGATLDTIKDQLNDPSRGVSAQIPYMEPARDKPGWLVFRIIVRLE